ncbi:MAG: YggT family protein [Gammaproteobacteria bacterium]|nr:MAG: YggT family protein [Gammaproteobacteria bacterium]
MFVVSLPKQSRPHVTGQPPWLTRPTPARPDKTAQEMSQALYFIIKTLTQLYLLVLLLRFWLPILGADFRNPLAQGILRVTSPLVVPVRRFVPSIGRLDTSTILIAYVIQFLTVLLLLTIGGYMVDTIPIMVTTLIELAVLSLNLFFFVILIKIILSWVAPHTHNYATALLTALAEPVLRPFRRIIPSIGGLDISPIFAIILLQAAVIFLQTLKPIHV